MNKSDISKKRADDHALTVRLPADLWERLVKRAAADERTVAGLIRLAARSYLASSADHQENP